jgi:hypothetical protein
MLKVCVMLDVKKMALPPLLLLTYEPDELLLVICDNDVAMPTPEDVVWAELDRELAGVE